MVLCSCATLHKEGILLPPEQNNTTLRMQRLHRNTMRTILWKWRKFETKVDDLLVYRLQQKAKQMSLV